MDNFKSKVNRFKEDLIGFNKSYAHNPSEIYQHELKQRFGLNLNVYIWGHSLDISDKDYILDLFSLNDDIDRNVRVTVYYFDKTAKFSLLNNLLAILDKDKVEQWMKNKWLCFKPNPEIKFLAQESPDVDQAS